MFKLRGPSAGFTASCGTGFHGLLGWALTRLALQVSDADSSSSGEFDLNDEAWRQSFHAIHAQRGSGRRGGVAWLGLPAEAVEAGSPRRV